MRRYDAYGAALSVLLWMAATGLWAAFLGWYIDVDGEIAGAAVFGGVIRCLVIMAEDT